MSAGESQTFAVEMERKLEAADSQLVLYARDLKQAVDRERARAHELAEANDRLRILDRLKTDFLTFISHELRTPLNAISIVSALSSCAEPRGQAELSRIIQRGYARLETFITKGLEYFEWLGINRVRVARPVALDALVRLAVELVPDLQKPGVDFRLSTIGKSFLVQADEASLAKVIRTLLENALKFSRDEKVVRLELSAAPGLLTVTVTDRGVGFPPEVARELFQPFTISDVDHHSEGTGLSLALARAIVEAHGGHLRAESPGPGGGASFIVALPVGAAEDKVSTE